MADYYNQKGPIYDDVPPIPDDDGDYDDPAPETTTTAMPRTTTTKTTTFNVKHLASFKFVPTPENEDEVEYINYGLDKLLEIDRKQNVLPLPCQMSIEKSELRITSQEEMSLDKSGSSELRIPLDTIVTAGIHLSSDASYTHSANYKFPNLIFFLATPELNSSEDDVHIFQGHDCLASDILEQYEKRKNEAGEDRRRASVKMRQSDRNTEDPIYAKARGSSIYGKRLSQQDAAIDAADAAMEAALRSAPPATNGDESHLDIPRPDGDVKNEVEDEEQTKADLDELDSCLTQIENFVERLQSHAEAEKERMRLEALKQGKKKTSNATKKIRAQERDLEKRLNLPTEQEFMDNFKVYKRSFNLIGKYGSRLQEPSAPEMVQHLFKPLHVVVDASKGPRNDQASVAGRVVQPVFTSDAKKLLKESLAPEDKRLWNSLGEAWTLSDNELSSQNGDHSSHSGGRRSVNGSVNSRDDNNNKNNPDGYGMLRYANKMDSQIQPSSNGTVLNATRSLAPNGGTAVSSDDMYGSTVYENPEGMVEYLDDDGNKIDKKLAELTFYEIRNDKIMLDEFAKRMHKYDADLKGRNVKFGEATFDRAAKFIQELTVRQSEVFEILDDSRNWWFIRNWRGEDGFIPKTIIKVIRQ